MKKLLTPLAIILFAVVMRLLSHPANMAPITGMALFGGVYLNKKYALVVPLLVMLVSDIFLGFHPSMPYVYFSFFLSGCIGLCLRKKKTVPNVILASLSSSILFFLITNFGFFLVNDLYPKTVAGQLEAYAAALPFFRNTVVGDLFYTGLFFGSYELARHMLRNPIRIHSE